MLGLNLLVLDWCHSGTCQKRTLIEVEDETKDTWVWSLEVALILLVADGFILE